MSQPEPATRSSHGPSDAALVVAGRAGETWALEALFRRHAPMINGLAFRLMGRDADVDDVVQEGFTRALTDLHRLENPQAFASWLAGIVVRVAYNLLRRRRLLARLGFQSVAPIDLDALCASSTPPDMAAELRDIYARIDRLPVKLRIPFLLRRVEGLGLEEIAEMTEASLATVKRRIRDAELKLNLDGIQTDSGAA